MGFFWQFLLVIYKTVLLATVVGVGFICYMIRTQSPRVKPEEEDEEPAEDEEVSMADPLDSDEDFDKWANDNQDMVEESHEVDAPRKGKRGGHVIREVTVRKILLPDDPKFGDLERLAARHLIGTAIQKKHADGGLHASEDERSASGMSGEVEPAH